MGHPMLRSRPPRRAAPCAAETWAQLHADSVEDGEGDLAQRARALCGLLATIPASIPYIASLARSPSRACREDARRLLVMAPWIAPRVRAHCGRMRREQLAELRRAL